MTVNGTVLDGFEAVRDAFGQAQADDEGGAQLAVCHQGQLVVDLWTGRDVADGRPYTGDSIGAGVGYTCINSRWNYAEGPGRPARAPARPVIGRGQLLGPSAAAR